MIFYLTLVYQNLMVYYFRKGCVRLCTILCVNISPCIVKYMELIGFLLH